MLVAAPTILPFASINPANVDTPATFKSSSSVYPSTSKLPLASIFPVNVEIPDTVKSVPIPRLLPSNVKLALSSSSPPVPAMTTLLSVKSPIAALSAERESIFAVPSIYKSFHC